MLYNQGHSQTDENLQDIIPDTSRFSRLFLDLLLRIFTYDPKRRITAKEALQHPWFSDTATPDDGTEAIRIKMQRQQEAAELAARRQRTTVTANGYHR